MSVQNPDKPPGYEFSFRAVVAEGICHFMAIYTASGITLTRNPDLAAVALGNGFGLAFPILAFAEVSLGHANPMGTLADCLAGRFHILYLIAYWVSQFAGAMAASGLLVAMLPESLWPTITANIFPGFNSIQGFVGELTGSFILRLALLITTDKRMVSPYGSMVPGITAGLTLAALVTVIAPTSGCALNPFRHLSNAIVTNIWHSSDWIYYAGPITGTILAVIVYDLIAPASVWVSPLYPWQYQQWRQTQPKMQ
jgi:glycerol uptake facilitator-like aquaporin